MRLASLLALGLAFTASASAQISFTGEYYQDFDDLGTDAQAALPDGWRADTFPIVQEPGAYADAQSATDLRGGILFSRDRPGGIVNFGSGPEDTAPERALGVALRPGIVQTGVIYVQFRNDTGEPIDALQIANFHERYRGGGSTTIFRDRFFSLDGISWTQMSGAGATTSGGLDGSEYPPSPIGGTGLVTLPQTVPSGSEWYFAYRFYATAVSDFAPAHAADQFGIASPTVEAGAVFLTGGDIEFGPVFIGERDHGAAEFGVVPGSALLGTGVFTGPHASDFIVTEVTGFSSSQYVRFDFQPTGPGWRYADLRLFAADTMSRSLAVRGFGVERPPLSGEDDAERAGLVRLEAWPNPSAGPVQLRIHLPEASSARLSVHDALGREVAVLLDRRFTAGSHDATFDPARLVPGVYFARLTTQGETVTSALTISR